MDTKVTLTLQQWITKNSVPEVQVTWTDPVLKIKLNRPQKKNALNRACIEFLLKLFPFIETQKNVRAVFLEGGPHQFCAGADLEEIAQIKNNGFDAICENNKLYGQLIFRISQSHIPVIALIDGPALGGGMGLACASDIILATQHAVFGMPEPKLGIMAGQIFPYVSRKLGLSRTQEMSLQGLAIKAEKAEKWGLISQIHPDYDSLNKAADTLVHNITNCGPNAIIKTKVMLNNTYPIDASNINAIAYQVAMATLSAEGLEGNTAFIEKRKPQWKAQ